MGPIELLIIVIVLAVPALFIWAGVTIANGKNRSPWLGAALGLGLGIIGLLILWIIPAATQRPATAVDDRSRLLTH
jgi:hypothetical protein